MQGTGVIIRGADPEKTLSTMLWRTAGVVVRLRGGGYWAADIPNEAFGYVPGRKQPVDAEELDMIQQDIRGELPDEDADPRSLAARMASGLTDEGDEPDASEQRFNAGIFS